ncbi:MAG TPA: hypothetical protein VHB79_28730 [Polyangiaceae bacterium]|nr:hypothetical protein [Polyangiaceae bacterium]
MPRELSPFELDRELARVAPRARHAYRTLRAGGEVTLRIPDVLVDPETLEQLADDTSDPIAAPLLRWLYWLQLMQRALPLEGERVRQYRIERHALDKPLSGHFSWRELLGHALRDRGRRSHLLDVLWERGSDLRDAGSRLYELRAGQPKFAGKDRAELEQSCPDVVEQARALLTSSADAYGSLELYRLSDLLERALATAAADGWPRQLSLRTLHDLLGSADWLSGLKLDLGELPAAVSAASFVRGFARLGAAWSDALAPTQQPYCIAHDAFGLQRAARGSLFASVPQCAPFLRRQLALGKERAFEHGRALAGSTLIFARTLALRVLQAEAALRGPDALREVFSEQGTVVLGFEPPPPAAGLLFRPRLGDEQRFAGLLLAAAREQELAEEHDDDWFRNPRAIDELRSEARQPPDTRCDAKSLERGVKALTASITSRL